MPLRCVLVDDSTQFLEAASSMLEGQGLEVGSASTSAEALALVRTLEPDLTVIDVNLNGESGFDLAWQLASSSHGAVTILTSTHSESDLAELVAITPVLGFISKNDLSGEAVRDILADRSHGKGCRHEALIYSSSEELAAGAVPFLRQGLALDEQLLVILREEARAVVRNALGDDADLVEFADAGDWYQSPQHAFQRYIRYLGERRASRVRVVAEVIWPEGTADVAGWKRYEAQVSGALASVPVSFICGYDTRELPAEIVADARRTHPVLRTDRGARPSEYYIDPSAFIHELEESVPDHYDRRRMRWKGSE